MMISITDADRQLSDAAYRHDLGDGLVLRWSTQADTEGIAFLYGSVFREKEHDPFNENMAQWTRDWMSDRHPHITSGDIALVEETASGRIVAATGLLSYDLEYEGITIPFAQPEIVATVPEYRNRGLVRRIFTLIHARSAAKGHLMQGITGILYYYRQFRYEYAVELDGDGDGGYSIQTSSIPKLKDAETDPYNLRHATVDDIPHLQRLYDAERRRGPISSPISDAYWRWLLVDANTAASVGMWIYMIVDAADNVVGYTMTGRYRWGDTLSIRGLWLDEGISWMAVALPLLRGWFTIGQQTPQRKTVEEPFTKIYFSISGDHPFYHTLGEAIIQLSSGDPYAWYMRIPDYVAFLRAIKPLLERRLATSFLANYSGVMKINLYRSGVKLVFSDGKLSEIEPWKRGDWEEAQVGCPPLIFTQLLLAHRSYDQIRTLVSDLVAKGAPNAELMRILFPAKRSSLIQLV